MLKAATLLAVAAAASAQHKVTVELYAESLCPGCQGVIKGPVNKTFAAEGVPAIMNFDYVPFGNAYVELQECAGRQGFPCWNKTCGAEANSPPADCYTGKVVCQHGNGECYGNYVEVCAKNMTQNDATRYMPFVTCFEILGDAKERDLERCAPQAGLSASAVSSCAAGPAGKALMAEAAKKTALVPNRDYVPYLVVNNRVLQEASFLLETVCRDYDGTKPPGCRRQ